MELIRQGTHLPVPFPSALKLTRTRILQSAGPVQRTKQVSCSRRVLCLFPKHKSDDVSITDFITWYGTLQSFVKREICCQMHPVLLLTVLTVHEDTDTTYNRKCDLYTFVKKTFKVYMYFMKFLLCGSALLLFYSVGAMTPPYRNTRT